MTNYAMKVLEAVNELQEHLMDVAISKERDPTKTLEIASARLAAVTDAILAVRKARNV